nr:hypothetical protein [Alkalibacillus haloalkaliphilus]
MNSRLAESKCVDSCGSKGLGETPQCVARGGSPAAHGKRSILMERAKSKNPNEFISDFVRVLCFYN